jgi:acetolactate synthase I/II/III large subunit
MRGADALIAALERAGVDTVFGMPGGASLPLYDALLDSNLRHVLMRHEAGAGHAAEGYARATGRVGVAFATSGPGATNLVTPICDAHMDSVPTLFVTGQVRTALRGSNAFQEADVIGITAPIVKHSLAVERADDIAQAVADAVHLATAGRPGPVLLDLPVDVASGLARDTPPHAPQLPGYRPRTKPNGRQLRIAAAAIAAARRPILYAGGGVVHAGAAAELTSLAHRTRMPVTTTLMALGTFPASDPQWLGMLGMHGTCAANWAIDEADLIVAVGARFDDRVTGALDEFAPRAKVVHIDVDPAEIGKNVAAHVPIVGDARLALAAIADAYDGSADLAQWWERIDSWRDDGAPRNDAEAALDALQAAIDADTIVTTDVGQHQMWAANRLRFERPRRWITSGGLGTMGFGLPAAIGAQIACPGATVVCVTGEGSLLLNVQELATAGHERLPVKIVVLDNRSLGMVRQQQDMFWGGRRSAVDLGATPDWPALAAAFGVRPCDDIGAALAHDGPALVRVAIDPDADCLPMFRPGGPAREIVTSPKAPARVAPGSGRP